MFTIAGGKNCIYFAFESVTQTLQFLRLTIPVSDPLLTKSRPMSRNFIPEQTLIDQLVANDTEAFEEIHRRYCFPLYSYCLAKLNAPEDAKRIVRDIFIRLWEKRASLPVNYSLQVELYSEVRREILNCLNEKLITEDDLPSISSHVLPGFAVYKLQEARKPVRADRNPRVNIQERTAAPQQPWWNQYPSFFNPRGMKLALEKVLHIF